MECVMERNTQKLETTPLGKRPNDTGAEDCQETKRVKQLHQHAVVRARMRKEQQNCTVVCLGKTGKLGNEVRIKYFKKTRFAAPYLKLTSLSDDVVDDTPCYPFDDCGEDMRIKKVVCIPVRVLLDLMHLILTGDSRIAKEYTSVFPCAWLDKKHNDDDDDDDDDDDKANNDKPLSDKNKQPDDHAYYELLLDDDKPGRMRVPVKFYELIDRKEHGKMPQNMGGFWGIYRQRRGGLFLSTGEGEPGEDNPQRVFPLCHGRQIRGVLAAVHDWLIENYRTKDLVIKCNVPQHMTLFPMPREEDDHFYGDYTLKHHWPELSEEEISNLVFTKRLGDVMLDYDTNEDPNTYFKED